MPSDAILKLTRVEKIYGTAANPLAALRDVELSVQPGEYAAIVGPSGAGKSTLLNILGCLDRPTRGEYWLAAQNVAQLDDERLSVVRRTRLGFVFQSFQLISHLSVLENVEMPLYYARNPRTQRRRRCLELLERVGLGPRTGHRPNQLSGGECQRAAIARALANDPAVILADEPTGNLDSATARDILNLIAELHASGRTILLITHDPGIAAAAPRRITLRDGRITSDERSEKGGHVSS
ncbi:ABC transporter ATP-binding protein [Phycisphaerae bacterium RAS1]|nr:ABC transporter ATP-binding protein [Phycisphaerae bacterium RAS1]